MQTLKIDTHHHHITQDCYIYDDGIMENVEIDIAPGICVDYCFISKKDPVGGIVPRRFRHIIVGANSQFIGTAVLMDEVDIEIITQIVGDNAKSNLDILALATDDARISACGVVRVSSPYREVSTRVDQTNILIGTGSRVRGVPRLEIATDDIEGGHSCRVHRLGGEALFYLTSRGLSEQHAETLLLNSEILRHLRTIEVTQREGICYEVHQRLLKKTH